MRGMHDRDHDSANIMMRISSGSEIVTNAIAASANSLETIAKAL